MDPFARLTDRQTDGRRARHQYSSLFLCTFPLSGAAGAGGMGNRAINIRTTRADADGSRPPGGRVGKTEEEAPLSSHPSPRSVGRSPPRVPFPSISPDRRGRRRSDFPPRKKPSAAAAKQEEERGIAAEKRPFSPPRCVRPSVCPPSSVLAFAPILQRARGYEVGGREEGEAGRQGRGSLSLPRQQY